MSKIAREPLYRRRRFPAEVIAREVWRISASRSACAWSRICRRLVTSSSRIRLFSNPTNWLGSASTAFATCRVRTGHACPYDGERHSAPLSPECLSSTTRNARGLTRRAKFHAHPMLRGYEIPDDSRDAVLYQLSSDAKRQRVGDADGKLSAQRQVPDWKRNDVSTVDVIGNR
jgi:hypothetical protein